MTRDDLSMPLTFHSDALPLPDIVTAIKENPAIRGNRGEYARRAVVNAFRVWQQALAAINEPSAAAATAVAAEDINLFEEKEMNVVYTPEDSAAANRAIRNASALINGLLADDDVSRWMANAMLRQTNPAPARDLGTALSQTIGELTAFIARPPRMSTEYDT